MQVIRITYPEQYILNHAEKTSIAVGYFDGVHIGHQEVIKKAKSIADERHIKSAVMTFDPHPITVLKQEKLSDYLISSLDEKLMLLEELGVDFVYVVTFNKELSKLTPKQFVKHFFIDLNVQHVVGGFDFSFGHKGAGKIQEMDQYTDQNLTFSVVDKVSLNHEKVSSTRIRTNLKEGNMELCRNLLGRPFSVTGKVIQGYQRGREIGFPTANIDVPDEHILPKVGVYAVTMTFRNQTWNGMANIGFNPTFTDQLTQPILEVNLFNFNENIYGETVHVHFHRYIRDEKKFEDVGQLIEQMKDDERISKKILDESY